MIKIKSSWARLRKKRWKKKNERRRGKGGFSLKVATDSPSITPNRNHSSARDNYNSTLSPSGPVFLRSFTLEGRLACFLSLLARGGRRVECFCLLLLVFSLVFFSHSLFVKGLWNSLFSYSCVCFVLLFLSYFDSYLLCFLFVWHEKPKYL